MRIDIATLFPEMCERVMLESITGRAVKAGKLAVHCHQIRDYTTDKHRRTDGIIYGGGMGMLMQAQPIYDCFSAVCDMAGSRPHVVYMSPQGSVFNQAKAGELAGRGHIMLICGHYEGVDQRVLDEIVDEEISLGDFVLTGGELGALVVADAVARLCDGVLAQDVCFEEESHYNGLLEYPQYARPYEWRGRTVPDILLTGHHANITEWRRQQSLKATLKKRPDLLKKVELTDADLVFLIDYMTELEAAAKLQNAQAAE